MRPLIASRSYNLLSRGRMLSLQEPQVMGILNANSDSFYGPSRVQEIDQALALAGQMIHEGATILDIGGASSRPGAAISDPREELARVLPLIQALRGAFPHVWLSVDTYHAAVARAVLEAGCDLINDISGGRLDPELPALAADFGVPYVLMHMRGVPATMAAQTHYTDLMAELFDYFATETQALRARGVSDILIDPGFGFAKDAEQNFVLLSHLNYLGHLSYPILVGLSRKSFIYRSLDLGPESVLSATSALHMLALQQGASILRVHDVAAARQVIRLWSALEEAAARKPAQA